MNNFYFKCLILCVFTCLSYQVKTQTLIMNEVSNGSSGAKEYVEFVVISNTVTYDCGNSTPPCIDIRGWIFDDNSGYHGTNGVADGAIRFSQNSLWSCIPLGTIILIYNAADRNPAIPADDISMIDGNCRIIAPVNGALFEVNGTTPGASACSYPTTGWTSAAIDSWTATAMANTGDCARIVNLAGCEVFSVCYGSPNLNTQIYFSGSGGQKVYYFNGTNPALQANWTNGDASANPADQTPGAANNAANAAYIGQFNNSCQPITSITVTATKVNAGCTCNGSATATATGSIPGYTYIWYDSAFNVIGQTGATASGLCSGIYNVIATSYIGCSDTTSVTISSSSTTSVTVDSQTICAGGSTVLTAMPSVAGGTYSWTPGGQTTQTISVNPTSTTNYSVTYTFSGCSGTGIGTVTVNSLPTVTVNSPTICAGQSATLTANGANTYTWDSGSTSNPLTVSPPSNTNFTVTGSIAGCSNTAIAIVSIIPLPTVTVNSATICTGQSATLTAGGATTYSWDNGSTANSLTVSPTSNTNYTVEGTTAAGCTNTAISMVTVNSLPTITVNSATICTGQTATLTASGASTYSWNTGAASASITDSPGSATIYTVTGTTLDCSNTSTASIAISSNLVLSVNSPTICSGQTATLLATGATSYTWSNGATGASITVSPTSLTSYTLNGSNGSCLGSTVTSVVVNPLPTITVTSPTFCAGQSTTLTANGATTYTWNTGSTSNPLIVSPTLDTNYTVTGTTNGCTDSISYLVNVVPSPTLVVNSPSICPGQTATLTANGANTYTWNTGSTSNSFTISPTLTTTFTVTGTSGICSSTSTTNITVNSLPIVSAGSKTICEGNTATLTAIGATTYSWDNGSTSNPLTVSPATTTIYTVTGDNSGCMASSSVTVTVIPSPTISFNSTLTAGCAPLCVPFSDLTTIVSGTIISWDWTFEDSPGSNEQNPLHCFNNSGLYDISLTVTSSNGCSKTSTTSDMINVFIKPKADFTTNLDITDILEPTIQFINVSTNATQYNWSFGDISSSTDFSPSHTYNHEGAYTTTLIATNTSGCKDTTIHEIIINDIFTFYAPNAFTPNQDNINDIFLPTGVGWNPDKYQLNIFDRWGKNCFSTKDPTIGWDGKANNGTEPAQIGVYTWKIELKDVFDKKHKFIGSIIILR